MKIKDVVKVLGAEIVCCKDGLDREVLSACASDMMSDVLAFVKDHAMLITGLNNPQVVRTAEMMDMKCVLYVRGKKPDAMSIQLAEKMNIVLLTCDKRMFMACGILYEAGLQGGDIQV